MLKKNWKKKDRKNLKNRRKKNRKILKSRFFSGCRATYVKLANFYIQTTQSSTDYSSTPQNSTNFLRTNYSLKCKIFGIWDFGFWDFRIFGIRNFRILWKTISPDFRIFCLAHRTPQPGFAQANPGFVFIFVVLSTLLDKKEMGKRAWRALFLYISLSIIKDLSRQPASPAQPRSTPKGVYVT